MNRNRLIFYAIFAAFHLILLVFTLYVEANRDDFGLLGQILKWMSWLKYGAMLGLVLLIVDVAWVMISNSENDREKEALHDEINTLKAKLFDLQEASKQPVEKPVNPGANN